MLDKKQIIIRPPEKVGFFARRYWMGDVDGNPLGSFVSQQNKIACYYENEIGARIGEIRLEGKFGLLEKILIFDPFNKMHGSIEGEGVDERLTKNIVKPRILKGPSGDIIATSDSFTYPKQIGVRRFDGVRESGLIIRNNSGEAIANVHSIPNFDGVAIDFSAIFKDQFALLSFVTFILI